MALTVTASLASDSDVPEQLAVKSWGALSPPTAGERLGLSSPIRISPYLLCAVAEHDREITLLRRWDGSPLTRAHAGWGQRRSYPGRLNSRNGVAADERPPRFRAVKRGVLMGLSE